MTPATAAAATMPSTPGSDITVAAPANAGADTRAVAKTNDAEVKTVFMAWFSLF